MTKPLSLAAELEPLDLETLRGLLARQATLRPHHDDPGFTAWMERRDAIRFQIEVKEGQARLAWKPAPGPNHPLPPPSPDQALPAETSARPPRLSEIPMPKPAAVDPSARIEDLLGRIRAAARKGQKCYWAQQTIREICQKHHLDVPPEAQKVYGTRQGQAKRAPVQRDTPRQSAPPQHLEKGGSPEASMRTEPEGDWKSFAGFQRALLRRVAALNSLTVPAEEWRRIARELALLETTAGAARQIAARQAEVA